MGHAHTVEDAVTIVYPTSNEGILFLAASAISDLYMVFICHNSQPLTTRLIHQPKDYDMTLKITGMSVEQV